MSQILFILFFVVIFARRFFVMNVTKRLSTEDKARLVDITQNLNWQTIVFFIFLLAMIVLGAFAHQYKTLADMSVLLIPLFGALMFIFAIWGRVAVYRRLKAAGLPGFYTNTILIINIISYVVIIALLITLHFAHLTH